MPHPLVLALFDDATAAAGAARLLRELGVPRERVSIVARTHDEEGELATAADASPGSEIEDSAPAARLGELGAHVLSAMALVMPGIGPIVADGPLAAGLGEAAGHLAGGLARTLSRAGLSEADAAAWERRIHAGAFLLGAHTQNGLEHKVAEVMRQNGSMSVAVGRWSDAGDRDD